MVLWEMVTCGSQPYDLESQDKIVELLLSEKTLEIPPDCSSVM